MSKLNGSKTHQNLKDAFAGESQANRRYLYFAQVADIEGRPEIAGNFKETADGETGHAHGHLKYLAQVGDPVAHFRGSGGGVCGLDNHRRRAVAPPLAPPAARLSARRPAAAPGPRVPSRSPRASARHRA